MSTTNMFCDNLFNLFIVLSESAEYAFSFLRSEDRGYENTFEPEDSNFIMNIPNLPYRFYGVEKTFILKILLIEAFKPQSINLGHNSKEETGMVGLENLGATCYLNSLLQMLFYINSFRECVYQLPYQDEVYGSSTTLALQNVFRQLQLSDKEVNTQVVNVTFSIRFL